MQVQHDLRNHLGQLMRLPRHGGSTLRSLTPGMARFLLPSLSPILTQPQNSVLKAVKYVLCDHN
jgi:hypothetical protein